MNFARDFVGFCKDVLHDISDLHFAGEGGVFISTFLFCSLFLNLFYQYKQYSQPHSEE